MTTVCPRAPCGKKKTKLILDLYGQEEKAT